MPIGLVSAGTAKAEFYFDNDSVVLPMDQGVSQGTHQTDSPRL